MGLSFHEVMRGPMKDAEGHTHLVDFTVHAEAPSLSHFIANGRAHLTGVVRARPWVESAALEGELHVSLVRERGMVYRFEFTGEDELRYRFEGRKRLDPRKLMRSASTLYCTIHRCGQTDELLAEGTLHFDLNDLPALAASFSAQSHFDALDLDAAEPGEPGFAPLSDKERALVAAYAEAIIWPGQIVPAVDAKSLRSAEDLLASFPGGLQSLYRGALKSLDALALARTGRGFARLDKDKRWELICSMDRLGPSGRGLRILLGMPVKTAHFSRRDYLDAVGVPTYTHVSNEPTPDYMQQVSTPADLEEETTVEADVVVIGTGAGGGPLAAHLAECGLAVALVEEGKYYQRKDFSGAPAERMRRFSRKSGMTFSLGNTIISIPLGKMVGGTTAINSGTCFRTPAGVLAEWRARGLPGDLNPESMDRYFREVEEELRVQPGVQPHLGPIADLVARGADAMGLSHAPLPRNAEGCDGQGSCAFGCPTEAKRSTNVSYIPRALRAGAELFTGMKVERLLMRGRRATGVLARGMTDAGAPRRLVIKADAVVVAAGAMGSPLLLADNGFRMPWLGKNLSIHPAIGMYVRAPEPMESWNTIPQGYGVDNLVDPRLRFEGFYIPPQLGAGLTAIDGPDLTRWMDAHAHVGQFGFMVKDPGVGHVRRGPKGGLLIRYDMAAETADLLSRGAGALAELLLQGGGEEVLACVGDVDIIHTIEEARALGQRSFQPKDFMSMAFHPLGTCRMGTSAADGVVNGENRVFGTDNLYVVDGSSVPSSLGVNPQVTIMAMALRAAEGLEARLA